MIVWEQRLRVRFKGHEIRTNKKKIRATNNTSNSIPADNEEMRRMPNSGSTAIFCRRR